MMRDRTPRLTELSHSLEMRWRFLLLADALFTALAVTLGASLGALLVRVAGDLSFSILRLLLVLNGSAMVVAILIVALRRRDQSRFFIDADRAYGFRSLLVSGYEFGRRGPDDRHDESRRPQSADRDAFERLVVERAEERSGDVNPRTVYPSRTPKSIGAVAALVVALGIFLTLQASGWFERPVPPYAEEAIMLEDAGRRLAERAESNDELRELAEEMRRLGRQVQRNELPPDEARRRIDRLNERVEEQLDDLARIPPIEHNEDAQIPPETENTIRQALRSGMSDGEVLEFFTRMRSQGNSTPDAVQALDESTSGGEPNASVEGEGERAQELMDQLESRPESAGGDDSYVRNPLEQSRQALQEMGAGRRQLSQGDTSEQGTPGESDSGGTRATGGSGDSRPQGSQSDESGEQESSGQEGGTLEVEDQMSDDFTRSRAASPVMREIEGVVTDDTIMDIIIRELPSEATSALTEQELDVVFERVVEEAVGREETPPELQQLVRNYFLRLTRANREGAADEQ